MTTSAPLTHRTFAAGTADGIPFVHDPLTGLTHLARDLLVSGRTVLPEQHVAQWPTVPSANLGRGVPISVCWSPLVRCNLNCPYCLDDKSVRGGDADERRRIAVTLGTSDVLAVDISGGEPLLLRDLGSLAEVLSASGQTVSVTTNGWHLERRAEAFAGRVDALRVSLDGPDAASHDRWRGLDSFRRAVAGVRAAVAHAIPVQLQCVVMASTHGMLQPLVDLAADLGTRGVTFLQMLPIGDGAAFPPQERLSDDEAGAAVAALDIPAGFAVRLRTREHAGGYTVIRADGRVWRNDPAAENIAALRPFTGPSDLRLPTPAASR